MKYLMIDIKALIKWNIVKSRLTPYLLLVDYIDYQRMQADLLEYFAIIQRPFNIVWSFVHF